MNKIKQKKIIAAMSAIFAMTTMITTVHADTNTRSQPPVGTVFSGNVSELAQGCYAIQSPKTGKYISQFKTADLINDGLSYIFSNQRPSKFYFKPTGLDNKFVLRDSSERYFGTHLPLQISAGRTSGEFVEWEISKMGGSNYGLKAVKLNRDLKHRTWGWKGGKLLLNNASWFAEDQFQLVSAEGCAEFPEVTTNVEGDIQRLKGDVNAPVRGFIDPHTHITSYEFMGGSMMAGKPFSPWGVEDALQDSKYAHGKGGALDIIGNLYTFGNLDKRYDTRGWPDFPYWPNYKQMSHMGYYYKWIERAYLSGQRIMVTNLVENEVLCNLQRSINPAAWVGNSCNTMDSIYKQIDSLKEMQDYIDAQAGGKGKGFFRIVTTPTEARQVIADGKLAVVLGVEASETFNCGQKDRDCNRNNIDKHLDKLHDMGVRSLFPIHKFDNQFGGSPVETGFINVGQWVSTGKFFETQMCDAETLGMKMESGFPLVGNLPFLKEVFDLIKLNPRYAEGEVHCNKRGLTDMGTYLVNRMIDKKMIIEFDHMSVNTANAVFEIAVNRDNFSGLMTSHGWMRKDESEGFDHYNTKRLLQMGGFAGTYNDETYEFIKDYNDYLTVVEDTEYLNGVGISTDMSGLGDQAPPRADAARNPMQYPYTTEFGTVFNKQVSGNREFDINKDGLAHYGLLPDHIQDIRNTDERTYEAIMNSAEAYLQMWERAMGSTRTRHHDPL